MGGFTSTKATHSATVYRAVFEHSFDAIVLGRPDGELLAANPAACELLGRSEDEICREGRAGVVDPASPGLAEFLAQRSSEGHARGVMTFVRGDGSKFHGDASSSQFLDDVGQVCTVTIMRDLSDQERVVAALAESDASLRAIVDSTSDLIWSVDSTRHRLLWFNEALRTYFRDRRGIALHRGMSPEELFDSQAFVDRWHSFYDVAERDGEMSTEYEASAGGSELLLTMRALTRGGDVYAISVFGRDVTEQRRMERENDRYVGALELAMNGTLRAVASMVELRDPYTAGHMHRVGLIAADLARELGWSHERCHGLELAGMVHDIGKIAVPAELLSKPTPLNPLEYQMIQSHVGWSYEILKHVQFPFAIAEVVRQHHERLDGSGYPRGLAGDEILPEARVLAVADALESMAAHRPYRPALGVVVALERIWAGRGTLFDPDVVDALGRMIHEQAYELPDPAVLADS